jgi:hypothetical protein
VPVVSLSNRKGEAKKRSASTSSGLAERTSSWTTRNTRFNLKLRPDILVPISLSGGTPAVTSGALLGRVLIEVWG